MRKVATAIFVLILSGMGAWASTAAAPPADQARTMSDVIDRVITNENRASQQIKFKPAKREGQPVDFPARVRIEFRLAY